MKKNLLHFYIWTTVLFSDYVMFAQFGEPNDDSDPDTGIPVEGDDAPMAPINGKLIFLALTGVLFAFYAFKRRRHAA